MKTGEIRNCKCCDKEFVFVNGGRRDYCSDECQNTMSVKKRREREAKYRERKRIQKARALNPNTALLSIDEIQKRAQAEHLSYGEYVKKYKV